MSTNYAELRQLAEAARAASSAMWAHQRATHGPWPAWCKDCLVPSDAREHADRAYGAAANPFTVLELLDYVENVALYRRTVRKHYLAGIECAHDRHTDKASCACSMWDCEPQPSVGAAVDAWMRHVEQEFADALSAERDAQNAQSNTQEMKENETNG